MTIKSMWFDKVAEVMTVNLPERGANVVAMGDGLIEIAASIGDLSCRHKSDGEPNILLFASGADNFAIVTRSPYLRAICARLAVIASGGKELKLNPYGDKAEFLWRAETTNPVRIRLEFENWNERWFRLISV